MVGEIKGHKMLLVIAAKACEFGCYRGRASFSVKNGRKHPEIHELDINPLFADERGVVVGMRGLALADLCIAQIF